MGGVGAPAGRPPRTAGTSPAHSCPTARSAASDREPPTRLPGDHRSSRARLRRRPWQRAERHRSTEGAACSHAWGRQAFRRWLTRPIEHVRELRSELLIKLLLLERSGTDETPLLRAQLALLERGELALAARVGETEGFDRTVAVWRLSTARAARSFVEALLDERIGEPINYEAIGYVRSAHTSLDGMPLQPAADQSGPSRIVLTEPHRGALQDLADFSHVWVLAHLHESVGLGRDRRSVPRRPAARHVRLAVTPPAEPDLALALPPRRRRARRARRRRARPPRRHAGARPEALRPALRHPRRARSRRGGSPTGPS